MFRWIGSLVDSNEKELRKLQPIVDRVNSLEPDFQRLSDAELRAKTDEFKKRLADGEELDKMLAEAFAAGREAARRHLGQRHFDVQLMGGAVLHQGKIAEMKTGEGKTLVATLPLYLNALEGKGCHLVTVNDYLSKRDAHWMGPIYHALGVTVGSVQHEASFVFDPSFDSGDPRWKWLRPVTRHEAYQADITYGTNNEFGFDYLRDNMVIDLSQCVQRELNYAIVDEVDNILIDEARTPLIISGQAEESAQKYYTFARLVPRLQPERDYKLEERERTVNLTDEGTGRVEEMLKKEGMLKSSNLYDPSNYTLTYFLDNALKAHVLFKRDRDYVVKDGQVIIVDEFTGRLMFGRRYSEGLHQAIEAKEGVKIQRESVTMATITFQNYFRMYHKLAGMTGTAATEAEEFHKIYKLEVVAIPTNKAMIRTEDTDQIYKNEEAKFRNVAKEIEKLHEKGQPVLVGTLSIEKSEHLSDMLTRNGVPHQVLNAKLHEKEAGIISQAGRQGAVTVATNMAGRGVDIILGGEPPGYTPDDDVDAYIQRTVGQFIQAGLGLLKDHTGSVDWWDEYQRRIAAKREETKRFQSDIRSQAISLGSEAISFWDRQEQLIVNGEQALRTLLTEYSSLNNDLADEVERRLAQIVEELEQRAQQTKEKPSGLIEKIRAIFGRKVKAEAPEAEILKALLRHREEFKEWAMRRKQVIDAGGLYVIGTERHEARRIDNQLRGRSGRQGDPGSSRFYVSLEDDVVRRFGGERIKGFMEWAGMDEDTPIQHSLVSKSIENAQVKVEGYHFEIRKHLVDYDDVVNKHREVIYAERRKILQGADLKGNILDLIEKELRGLIADHIAGERETWDPEGLAQDVSAIIPLPSGLDAKTMVEIDKEQVEERLISQAHELYEKREHELGADNMRVLERLVMLRVIDSLWVDHLTMMEHMRHGIGLEAAGQRDPLVAYKHEGYALFQSLLANIQHDVVHMIFQVRIDKQRAPAPVSTPVSQAAAAQRGNPNAGVKGNKKVGRNDPCPCGSGKKYKKCHGKAE